MNRINMPGFTAEASVCPDLQQMTSMYTRHGIGMTHITVSQNTTERIQPAMRYNCFNLGTIVVPLYLGWQSWYGVFLGGYR